MNKLKERFKTIFSVDKKDTAVRKTSHRFPPMPAKEQLKVEFDQFLEKMSMPAQTKDKMRSLPDENKQLLICQSKIVSDVSDKDSTVNQISRLKGSSLSPTDLRTLKVVISSKTVDQMKDFVSRNGLEVLIACRRPSRKSATNEVEVLRCLKAFMNSEHGLKVMIEKPSIVETIIFQLSSSDTLTLRLVLEILTVICQVSNDGHNIICEGLKKYMVELSYRTPYSVLVRILGSAPVESREVSKSAHRKPSAQPPTPVYTQTQPVTPTSTTNQARTASPFNLDLKTSVMTFINSVINSFHLLEERISNRSYLFDDDIRETIRFNRDIICTQKSDPTALLLETQFDVFEREYDYDLQETRRSAVDLSDPDSVWSLIRQNSKENGYSAYLLDTIKYLLIIPSVHRLRDVLWLNCQYSLRFATAQVLKDVNLPTVADEALTQNISKIMKEEDTKSADEVVEIQSEHQANKSKENETRLLRYDEIDFLMRQKNIRDSIVLESQAKISVDVESLRKEFHTYKMEKEAEIDKLMKRLKEAESKAREDKPKVSAVPAPAAPPSVASSTVPAPPPPGAASTIPAPPIPGAAPPIAAPPPPMAPGVAAPPAPMAPPAPGAPCAPGVPAPPGAPSAPGIGKAPAAYLPEKNNPAPRTKMKILHQSILTVNKIQGTIWDEVKDDNIKIDLSEFEEAFQAKAPVNLKKKADSDTKKVVKEVVSLIDSKRAQNVEIALSRFKMSATQIRDAILEMDSKVLDNEKIQKLLGLVPTSEEAEACVSYDGDINQLGATERFFHSVGNIKNIRPRLELFSFKLQFDTIYSDILEQVKVVQRACDAIKGNKGFKIFLSVVLKHGNYLNGGSKKGGVYGFKLTTLRLLESTKSIDNKMSLMQYLVHYSEQNFPEDIRKIEELGPAVSDAVRVESNGLQSDINKIKNSVNKLGSMLKSQPDSGPDRFKPVMESFFDEACNRIETLHTSFKKAETDSDNLSVSFGEQKGKMKQEDLFKLFEAFCKSFKNAQLYQKNIQEKEEKEKRKEQYAKENKERLAKVKEKREQKPSGKGLADDVLASVQGAAASSIIEEIRRRRNR